MRRLIALGAIALLSFGGCAEDEAPSGISTARAQMKPLVDAACDWMFGCCNPNELAYQVGDFTLDAANCSDRILESITAGAPLNLQQDGLSAEQASGLLVLALSINEGRVSVDSTAVAACADATRAQACNTPLEVTDGGRCTPGEEEPEDPCNPEEMFRGRQAVGEECDGPWECKQGLRCIDFFNAGVCAKAALEGEYCYADIECAEGLVCDWAQGQCAPGALAGQPCAFADPMRPVPGTETTRCATDLFCDPGSSTCVGGFCSPGAPCFDVFGDSDCPEAYFCVVNEGGGATCRSPGAVGESCNKDADCASDFCSPLNNTCDERLSNGQPCNFGDECQSGYCDNFMTFTCADAVANGQPCPSFDNEQCAAGYCDSFTDPALPVCRAYAGEGQACPLGFECDSELACAAGTCLRTPFPNGTSCFNGADCESNVCFMSMCSPGANIGAACAGDGSTEPCILGSFCDVVPGAANGVCAALRRTGEPCERSEQCWGECVVRFGDFMCDGTPAFLLDELWCDGN